MSYSLRERNKNVVYVESNDPQIDSHRQKKTKRKNATRSTLRIGEVPTRWDKRSRRSNRIAVGQQSNEINEVAESSYIERGSFSREHPIPSMENDSASIQGHSSCMELRQNNLDGEVGQGPNLEGGSVYLEEPTQPIPSREEGSSLPETTSSSPKTILSWLIDCELVDEDEQICYVGDRHNTETFTGRITRAGILCNCCQKEISVWTFEIHAGSDLKQPYEHIYLVKKSTCLKDLLITAWNKPTEQKRREMFSFPSKVTSTNQNDDACSICGDGGDLFGCENCPSTFHPHCINMERAPKRDWLCPYCVCTYCRIQKESQIIMCSQCDKLVHWVCKKPMDLNSPRFYCGQNCRTVYEKLDSSTTKTEIHESYFWRIIRPMNMNPTSLAPRNKILENNSKVVVSSMLLNESFGILLDKQTRINVTESVAYSRGSNFTKINFSRFHTFILEKDDAIICVASIRIHGGKVAEMPFIATEKTCRRQGICRMLMTVIESFLRDLKVQNLIIQSVHNTSEMWKHKFGFKELTRELKREMASYNILMFPHAIKLYKDLSSSIAEAPESLILRTQQDPFIDLNEDPTE